MNGEVTNDLQFVIAILADALRLEGYRGKLRSVEIIRAAQIVVTIVIAGIDRGDIHSGIHAGFGGVVVIHDGGTTNLRESPVYVADAHMADGEASRSMCRIDLPL